MQVWKLESGESRDIDTGVSSRMAWGSVADANGFVDGYPDGVAGNANAYKTLIDTESNQSKDRTLDSGIASQFDTLNTTGAGAALRSFTWADLDGDGMLDLIGFGNSIRVHTGAITDTPFVNIDCNPPQVDCPSDPSLIAFAGAVLPSPDGARIVVAPFSSTPPQPRVVYEITVNADRSISYIPLPLSPTCANCGIEAIVVRDFDGDHLPDLLVIEDTLTLDLARSSKDPTLHTFDPPDYHPVERPGVRPRPHVGQRNAALALQLVTPQEVDQVRAIHLRGARGLRDVAVRLRHQALEVAQLELADDERADILVRTDRLVVTVARRLVPRRR